MFFSNVLASIVAGLLLIVAGATTSYLGRNRILNVIDALRVHLGKVTDYSYLSEFTYLYWVSRVPQVGAPVWLRGVQHLSANGERVQGVTRVESPEVKWRDFRENGRIRDGNLAMLDNCVENGAEFASILYSSINSIGPLVGAWIGRDNLNSPVAAPIILSRQQLSADDLNKALKAAPLYLIPTKPYQLR